MAKANPDRVSQLATPQDAARHVLATRLAGESCVVTHGDLVDAVASRCGDLRRAAEPALAFT